MTLAHARPAAMAVAAFALTVPGAAQAYIGPGAGLGAVAVTLALLLGVLLLAVGLIWYPLKRLIKGRKLAVERGDAVDRPE